MGSWEKQGGRRRKNQRDGDGIWFYKFSKVIMDEYRLLMILESEFDPAAQQLSATAYEWI
jgi:hypothetical protein